MPKKSSALSKVFHYGVQPQAAPYQSCPAISTQQPINCSEESPTAASCSNHGRHVCCLLASEAQAPGPVVALHTFEGLVYSASQGAPLESWAELGCQAFQPVSTTSPTSAMATQLGSGSPKWVATAHKDFKIRLWRMSSRAKAQLQLVATLPSLSQILHNWTLQQRYLQTRRHGKKHAWMQHADTISTLAFSADCTILYSASWDRTVKVWNLVHLRCEETFTAHIDSINTMVAGSADGLLYTGSADRSIRVWSRRPEATGGGGLLKWKCKHSLVVELQEQGAAVNALVLSGDGSLLFSAGSNGRILVWKKSSSPRWPHKVADEEPLLQVEEKLYGHSRAVLCLDLLQSECMQGQLLVSGSADKTIRLWRRQLRLCGEGAEGSQHCYSHECVGLLTGHTSPVRSLRVSVVEELRGVCAGVAISGSLDGSIKMWMLATSVQVHGTPNQHDSQESGVFGCLKGVDMSQCSCAKWHSFLL